MPRNAWRNPPKRMGLTVAIMRITPESSSFLTRPRIEIIAGDDEDLWRVVDESIRSLPGVDQTWWASTVSVEKESYWLEPPQDGVLLDD